MDWKLILCMGLAAAGLLFGLSQWLRARRQLERMDRMLDRAIDGSFLESSFDESVPSALESKMSRFLNGSASSARNLAEEKSKIAALIADVSHQTKTPIANLKMLNETMLTRPISEEQRREFLQATGSQLDKLDFLMQAMIKTSRLETGVISLEQKQQPVYDTLAAALGGILLNAEKKQIDVQVECPEHLDARHDRKWTSEALFNILDNAVKYTGVGGNIRIQAQVTDFYNFSGINDITTNNDNYLETSHYMPQVGDRMLDVMFKGQVDERLLAQGFGVTHQLPRRLSPRLQGKERKGDVGEFVIHHRAGDAGRQIFRLIAELLARLIKLLRHLGRRGLILQRQGYQRHARAGIGLRAIVPL